MRHCKTALLFVIISLAIFLPVNFAEALKSSGNLLPQTNSQMVCGVHICESPMSIQEKIMMYLFGTASDDVSSDSPVFSFGGVLPSGVLATYCNDMTIDELINSGQYNVIDNRAQTEAQDSRGTSGADLYLASNLGDEFEGENGNDCIIGNSGRDKLKGRDGNDMIFGGGGDDDLRGNSGNDYLDGGAGRDELNGGRNNDICITDGEDTEIRNCEMVETTTTGEVGEPQTTGEIIVTTRDPSYTFGQSIRVEGTVPGVTNGRVTINIMDPSGAVMDSKGEGIRSDGTFSQGFSTSSSWTLSGTYSIDVTLDTLSGQTTFSFTGNESPTTGEITVSTRNPSYTFGQSIRVDG
ncbi:MAG: calcium-binding protein, partial [Thaumarchaeota archaeon]|nr:calcium-binding protein [Nitrososphaerota archaeon]